MVPAALRRLGTLGLIALWVLMAGGLLLLLALSAQSSMQYKNLQAWILLINAIAVVVVSVLLARKIIELVRSFRAGVPGSRLTARTVSERRPRRTPARRATRYWRLAESCGESRKGQASTVPSASRASSSVA